MSSNVLFYIIIIKSTVHLFVENFLLFFFNEDKIMCTKCELWWVMTKPWTNEALLRVFCGPRCRLICSDLAFPAVIYHLARSCDAFLSVINPPTLQIHQTLSLSQLLGFTHDPLDLCERLALIPVVEIWVNFHSRTTRSELFFFLVGPGGTRPCWLWVFEG